MCCNRLGLAHLDPALEDSTADYDEAVDFEQLQDTSHVSVVTVGEEKEHVKDSASVDGTDTRTPGSHGDGRSSKSDSGKHPETCSVLVINSFLIRTPCCHKKQLSYSCSIQTVQKRHFLEIYMVFRIYLGILEHCMVIQVKELSVYELLSFSTTFSPLL